MLPVYSVRDAPGLYLQVYPPPTPGGFWQGVLKRLKIGKLRFRPVQKSVQGHETEKLTAWFQVVKILASGARVNVGPPPSAFCMNVKRKDLRKLQFGN
jgi:hypothetical protein